MKVYKLNFVKMLQEDIKICEIWKYFPTAHNETFKPDIQYCYNISRWISVLDIKLGKIVYIEMGDPISDKNINIWLPDHWWDNNMKLIYDILHVKFHFFKTYAFKILFSVTSQSGNWN